MKAHSETHFENENMFLEKWKVIKEDRVKLDSRMFCYTWYKSLRARELEDGRGKKARPNPCAAAEHSGQIKRDTTLHKS